MTPGKASIPAIRDMSCLSCHCTGGISFLTESPYAGFMDSDPGAWVVAPME